MIYQTCQNEVPGQHQLVRSAPVVFDQTNHTPKVAFTIAVIQFASMTKFEQTVPTAWISQLGNWRFDEEARVRFVGAEASIQSGGDSIGIGIAISDVDRFTEGSIIANVRFEGPISKGHSAGIIMGFRSFNEPFYYVEFGDLVKYSVSRYEPGLFRPLARTGSVRLEADHPYKIEATLHGLSIDLRVNGVKILDALLSSQAPGHQIGVLATGPTVVAFDSVTVQRARPRAFVAAEFRETFDRLWDHLIERTILDEKLEPIRIDEVAGSNPILADIKRHVEEAAVVVAEITTLNPNVFFEIGYADALRKPLILIAQQGLKLPFDISGYRTIFYEDVIGGETILEERLRAQLRAVL